MTVEEKIFELHRKAHNLAFTCYLRKGFVPLPLPKILEATASVQAFLKYNPDEPRDWHGRWTTGGSGMNVDAAVQHLDQSAHASSTGKCARYVRQAIQAGGIDVTPPKTPSGMDAPPASIYGPALENAGFTSVATSNQPADYPPSGYTPQAGDVTVIQPTTNNPDGHMAMYNGQTWVSDFVQHGFWPGSTYSTEKPSFVIYRYRK